MKDGSCPEIKLFIPAGSFNSPQHLVEQIQIAIEENVELFYVKSTEWSH